MPGVKVIKLFFTSSLMEGQSKLVLLFLARPIQICLQCASKDLFSRNCNFKIVVAVLRDRLRKSLLKLSLYRTTLGQTPLLSTNMKLSKGTYDVQTL